MFSRTQDSSLQPPPPTRVLTAPAEHTKRVAGILFDVNQLTLLQAHFYPATRRTNTTNAFFPLQTPLTRFILN